MRSVPLFMSGITIVVAGVLPLLYSEYRLSLNNWAPLTMPIRSTAGDVKTPDFVTDYTGTYVVRLAFDANDVEREECLIGDRLNKDSCETPGSGLGLDMSVATGDRVIVDHRVYKPYGFGGAGEIASELGRFEGIRNRRYTIVLRNIQMAPELIAAHPRLKVTVHWAAWEQWVILKQLGFWVAILFGAVGLTCMILAVVSPQRQRSST